MSVKILLDYHSPITYGGIESNSRRRVTLSPGQNIIDDSEWEFIKDKPVTKGLLSMGQMKFKKYLGNVPDESPAKDKTESQTNINKEGDKDGKPKDKS